MTRLPGFLATVSLFRVDTEPQDRWRIIKQDSSRLEPFDADSFASAMRDLLE